MSKRRRRPLVLAAVAVTALAAAGFGVYLLDGGSGDTSCLARAAAHIPPVEDEPASMIERLMSGGDLERARSAGFDDSGSIHDVSDSYRETGVLPDLLSYQAMARLDEATAPSETAGYDSSQVSCWVGLDAGEASAAVGDFDEAAVTNSERGEDGEVATDGSLLTYDGDGDGAAAGLLDHEESISGDLAVLLDELDGHEIASFTILNLGDDAGDSAPNPPVAVGTAHDDGWELLIIWLFPDADTADEGYDAIISQTAEYESRIPDFGGGDPVDHLDQDETLVTLKAPLAIPTYWQTLVATIDSILFPLQE